MQDEANDDSRLFTAATADPPHLAAFFEEDAHGGYLYVSDRKDNRIVRDLRIYDNFNHWGLKEEGKMRGIIDLARGKEGRVWLRTPETPGIGDPEWLSGF